MAVTMTIKGQVTIPKQVREFLGLRPGIKIEFRRTQNGEVVIERADHMQSSSRFAKLRGHAGPGMSTEQIMALTRSDNS